MKWLCDITYIATTYTQHIEGSSALSTPTVYQAVSHWHPGVLSLYPCNLIISYSLTISYAQSSI